MEAMKQYMCSPLTAQPAGRASLGSPASVVALEDGFADAPPQPQQHLVLCEVVYSLKCFVHATKVRNAMAKSTGQIKSRVLTKNVVRRGIEQGFKFYAIPAI